MTLLHAGDLSRPDGKARALFTVIRDAGGRGATVEDLEAATGLSGKSFAPLLWALEQSGDVVRGGVRERPAPGCWPSFVYLTPRSLAIAADPCAGDTEGRRLLAV